VQEFKKRWCIETGFRDHELFSPTSHAHDNATKIFLHVLDLVSYNMLKIHAALFKKAKHTNRLTKRVPTIRKYKRDSAKTYVRGKNLTRPIMDAAVSSAISLNK
jgi:hypothetical protein